MKKETLLKQLTRNPKFKDYTYAVLFFMISSFFALFVIKPVLTIAFSLQREAKDLASLNQVYENNVVAIIDIQTKLETLRDRLFIVDEALPSNPQAQDVVTAVQTAALEQGLSIRNLTLETISYKKAVGQLGTVTVSLDANGDFGQVQAFISRLAGKRRINAINAVKITRQEVVEGQSSYLRLQMAVEAYYL